MRLSSCMKMNYDFKSAISPDENEFRVILSGKQVEHPITSHGTWSETPQYERTGLLADLDDCAQVQPCASAS
jgi:hypothetical protein